MREKAWLEASATPGGMSGPEGMLSPGVCGSNQLVPVVGMMCGVIQTAAAVLTKAPREGAAQE